MVEGGVYAVGLDVRALIGAAVTIALVAPARADDVDVVATLGWSPTARTVAPRDRHTRVYAKADRTRAIGALARDARLAWTSAQTGDKRCPVWLALVPRGFVCARDVVPSEDAPAAHTLPTGDYADVRGAELEVFATAADVRAGVATGTIPGTTFVAIRSRSLTVGGVRYVETDQGYVPAQRLARHTPSTWAGFDPRVTPPPAWPFAWVLPRRRGELVDVLAAPAKRAAVVATLAARSTVPVFESQGRWTRVGVDQWIETARLRVARQTTAPIGVAPDERWIDIDLEEQVLIAYDGATPVYATLISSGRKKWRSPWGVYRIRSKDERIRMRSGATARAHWDVADVPWSMGFREHFALHGAYWHDGFGTPRSHGCVNLSPTDAAHLFRWAGPELPAGWRSRGTIANDPADFSSGTAVRLRDRRHPDPPWRGYHGERISQ